MMADANRAHRERNRRMNKTNSGKKREKKKSSQYKRDSEIVSTVKKRGRPIAGYRLDKDIILKIIEAKEKKRGERS